MGKHMKLIPLPFKHTKSPSFSSSSWPWPICADPKAFSFRAENTTMNSIFVPEEHSEYIATSTESNSASESSRRHVLSITDELDKEDLNNADAIENVIRGVKKSERLFFEPSEASSSILGEPDKNKISTSSEDEHDDLESTRFVVIEMETRDPFLEFKESMKEMVEAHGLKNLDDLEELLNCYLKVNKKCNHGHIIGAFVDLLVNLDDFDFVFSSVASSFSSDSQSTTCISQSPSSLSSFSTSNCKSTTATSGVSSSEDEEARA